MVFYKRNSYILFSNKKSYIYFLFDQWGITDLFTYPLRERLFVIILDILIK